METQKLHVISYNYYSRQKDRWNPKAGDYYTTPRADLELYRIVKEDEEYFYTVYCHDERMIEAKWKKEEFISPNTFGLFRIHVPEWVFELKVI